MRTALEDILVSLLKVKGKATYRVLSQMVLLFEIEHTLRHRRPYAVKGFVKERHGADPIGLAECLSGFKESFEELYVGERKVKKRLFSLTNSLQGDKISEDLLVIANYISSMDDPTLSLMVHSLPAVKYANHGERIKLAELLFRNESQYWHFIDLAYDLGIEDDDDLLGLALELLKRV